LRHELKPQTAFAGRVCQNFDFSVIKKSAAVKNDVVDLFREGAFRNGFANRRRRYAIGRSFIFTEQRTFRCRRRSQRPASVIIDNLRVNMFAGKMNGQPRAVCCARNFFPYSLMNTLARGFTGRRHIY
jgi:hypothetical protein